MTLCPVQTNLLYFEFESAIFQFKGLLLLLLLLLFHHLLTAVGASYQDEHIAQ